MNHFANNGIEILKSKKTRNSKPKKKNVDLLKRFLKKYENELVSDENTKRQN